VRCTPCRLRAAGGRVFGQVVQAGVGGVEPAGQAVAGPGGPQLVAEGTRAIGFPLVLDEDLIRASAARTATDEPGRILILCHVRQAIALPWVFWYNGGGRMSVDPMAIGEDNMKTEISIPNPIYEAAERLAEELGMSLSEFYVAALSAYVAAHQNGDITKKLDEVYAKEDSALEPEVVAIQVASIGKEKW
jgi:hypothetical protein